MKLEHFKPSNFEEFKGNEIKNPFAIQGGYLAYDKTTWDEPATGKSGKDTWEHGDEASQNDFKWGHKGDIHYDLAVPLPDNPMEPFTNYMNLGPLGEGEIWP